MSLPLELWDYHRTRKKYWAAPAPVVTPLIGAPFVRGQSSALAPFI
jgi:hypothetical protein